MGAGIAEVACTAGFETHLHDPVEAALERGGEQIVRHIERSVERGRMTREEADAALARLHPHTDLRALSPCALVIEAAPEDIDIKRRLFGELSEVCGPETVLATNTSSLPVTALATGAS